MIRPPAGLSFALYQCGAGRHPLAPNNANGALTQHGLLRTPVQPREPRIDRPRAAILRNWQGALSLHPRKASDRCAGFDKSPVPGGGLSMARRPAALIPRRGQPSTVTSRPKPDLSRVAFEGRFARIRDTRKDRRARRGLSRGIPRHHGRNGPAPHPPGQSPASRAASQAWRLWRRFSSITAMRRSRSRLSFCITRHSL